MARLEFELIYNDVEIQHVSNNATESFYQSYYD